jgi:hypothetical protein
MFSFVLPARAGTGYFQTKNPRLTGNRGFCRKSIVYRLENSTHDARRRDATLPNGRVSLGQPGAALHCKRVCHFLTPLRKHYFREFVKKISVPFL